MCPRDGLEGLDSLWSEQGGPPTCLPPQGPFLAEPGLGAQDCWEEGAGPGAAGQVEYLGPGARYSGEQARMEDPPVRWARAWQDVHQESPLLSKICVPGVESQLLPRSIGHAWLGPKRWWPRTNGKK